jgi:hypothetical protein
MRLESFNLPVKVLWLKSADLLQHFHDSNLDESLEQSVEKVVIELANTECNLETLEAIPKLTVFKN